MAEHKIEPQNVTKPIQLLAAWLVGLILINASFLGAAKVISSPDWAAGVLVIASIINVPLFLTLIFFLQTKFRAELQEDTYYSKHLDKITGKETDDNSSKESFLNHIQEVQKNNDGNFSSINNALDDISGLLSKINSSSFDSTELENKVAEAQNSISNIEKKNNLKNTKIAINTKLRNYKKISKELVQNGFNLGETFGKNTPQELTISYLPNINKAALNEIYSLLKPYGFNRIDIDTTTFNSREAEVYIGSYIDEFPEERTSIIIDQEVERLLSDDTVEIEELNSYVLSESA